MRTNHHLKPGTALSLLASILTLAVCQVTAEPSSAPEGTRVLSELRGEPYFEKWHDDTDDLVMKTAKGGEVPSGTREALLAYLARNRETLDHVVVLAAGSKVVPFLQQPRFKLARQVGDGLVARAITRPQEEIAQSVEDCLAAIRLSRAIAWGQDRHPVVIDTMTACAVAGAPVRTLTRWATSGKLDPAQAARVLKELGSRKADPPPALSQIIINEGEFAASELSRPSANMDPRELWPEGELPMSRVQLARALPTFAHAVKEHFAVLGRQVAEGKAVSSDAQTLPENATLEEQALARLIRRSTPTIETMKSRLEEREAQFSALELLCGNIAEK